MDLLLPPGAPDPPLSSFFLPAPHAASVAVRSAAAAGTASSRCVRLRITSIPTPFSAADLDADVSCQDSGYFRTPLRRPRDAGGWTASTVEPRGVGGH